HLRRAVIGAARLLRCPLSHMIRARADVRHHWRIVVGDLARTYRIADVEYANAGIEVAAGERRRLMIVVDAAVMRAVKEAGKARDVGYDLRAIGRIVRLEHQLGDDAWLRLVAHVDDAGDRERQQAHVAYRLPRRNRIAAGTGLIHEDDVGFF